MTFMLSSLWCWWTRRSTPQVIGTAKHDEAVTVRDALIIYKVRPDLHLRLLRLMCELECLRKPLPAHPGVCSELRCLPRGRHDLGQLLAVADAQLGEDTVEVA